MAVRALRIALLAVGATLAAFFVYAVVQRFRFPVELEWMSGGVFDHIERVRNGQPIYAPPSAEFIAFLYPPLYLWVSGFVARFASIFVASHLVSLAATGCTAACSYRIAQRLGATRYWSVVAVLLFVSAYSFTGYWYDLERADSLLMGMLTLGAVVALESDGAFGALVSGALIGGAFFAKQPASVFFVATLAGFALARRYRRAGFFALGGALVVVPLFAFLHVSTGGWYEYYCLKVPSSHGIEPRLFTTFFVLDLSRGFALTGATVVGLVAFARAAYGSFRGRPIEERSALFGALLAAAFFTSATSRLHSGGWLNVLMFWSTFACIALAVAASKLEERAAGGPMAASVSALVLGAALLQMGAFAYDPGEASPNQGRVRDAAIVAARIGELEQDGDVLVPGRGHLTKNRHFHAMALIDVLRAGQPLPKDLVENLEQRRYAAYVVDEFGELTIEALLGHRSELFDIVTRNYFIAQRMDDREPPPVVGWIAHPSWVLRPRTVPLVGFTAEMLDRRQKIEMGLAEARMRQVQAGVRKVDDGAEIETLAAEIDARAPLAGRAP
jgi:hypothetical protein